MPETPEIFQDGDSLISSAVDGIQWFNTGGLISGATGQVYYPEAEDDYYVIATNSSGCKSDTSNIIHFLFTGIEDKSSTSTIIIYPNPFQDQLKIIFADKPVVGIFIRVTDILGRELLTQEIPTVDLGEIIIIPTRGLKNCLYLISVIDSEGNMLISKKLIKD